jgi:hypothetical protein
MPVQHIKKPIYIKKNTENNVKHQIKPGYNFLFRSKSVFSGNIEAQNNHNQTFIVKWNSSTPNFLFFIDGIGANNDFSLFSWNPMTSSLISLIQ